MAGGEMMKFPKTVDEFMESYKIVDTEQVYANGAELVPIFRMRQWFEHLNEAEWISVKDRLPELYQNVLVHYYNPHCVEPHNFAVAFRQDGRDELIPGMYIWHVDSSPMGLDESDVTHWMPLPGPPKEVQDGD